MTFRFTSIPGEPAVLVAARAATPDERTRALPFERAWRLLDRLRLQQAWVPQTAPPALRALLRDATGVDVATRSAGLMKDLLESCLRSRRLLVVAEAPRVLLPAPAKASQEPPLHFGETAAALSWIEIVIVDGFGNGVAGQECVVNAPDGSPRRAVTDREGKLRLDRVAAGTCRVTFPGLDGRALEPA